MAYYTKVLQPGESVRYVGRLHWIIHKNAMISGLVTGGVGLLVLLRSEPHQPMVLLLVSVPLAVTLYFYSASWMKRKTTEIVVTDRRIIHKIGWITRRTEEINITKVETVDVEQGIAGRILGYGTVGIKGVGGSWEPLRKINAPLELRNAIVVG